MYTVVKSCTPVHVTVKLIVKSVTCNPQKLAMDTQGKRLENTQPVLTGC